MACISHQTAHADSSPSVFGKMNLCCIRGTIVYWIVLNIEPESWLRCWNLHKWRSDESYAHNMGLYKLLNCTYSLFLILPSKVNLESIRAMAVFWIIPSRKLKPRYEAKIFRFEIRWKIRPHELCRLLNCSHWRWGTVSVCRLVAYTGHMASAINGSSDMETLASNWCF